MTVNEEKRAELYKAFCDSVGTEVTNTFMEMLPPFDWSNVARKSDLDMLRAEMNGRFIEINSKVDRGFIEVNGKIDTRLIEIDSRVVEVNSMISMIERDFKRLNRSLGWLFSLTLAASTLIIGFLFQLSSQIAGLK